MLSNYTYLVDDQKRAEIITTLPEPKPVEPVSVEQLTNSVYIMVNFKMKKALSNGIFESSFDVEYDESPENPENENDIFDVNYIEALNSDVIRTMIPELLKKLRKDGVHMHVSFVPNNGKYPGSVDLIECQVIQINDKKVGNLEKHEYRLKTKAEHCTHSDSCKYVSNSINKN